MKQITMDKWPFTVEAGQFYCYEIIPDKAYAAIFEHNGVEYQINGIAKMQGYKCIDPLLLKGANLTEAIRIALAYVWVKP